MTHKQKLEVQQIKQPWERWSRKAKSSIYTQKKNRCFTLLCAYGILQAKLLAWNWHLSPWQISVNANWIFYVSGGFFLPEASCSPAVLIAHVIHECSCVHTSSWHGARSGVLPAGFFSSNFTKFFTFSSFRSQVKYDFLTEVISWSPYFGQIPLLSDFIAPWATFHTSLTIGAI